jgi:hypothetical protein
MQHVRAVRTPRPDVRSVSSPAQVVGSSISNLAVARARRRGVEDHADFEEAGDLDDATDTSAHLDEQVACADSGRRPLLARGAVGPSVETVQCRLNTTHTKSTVQGGEPIANAPLDVDGIFGDHTHNAVLSFQQQVFPVTPVEWDGIVGPKTWAALDAAVTGDRPPAYCPRPNGGMSDAFASFVDPSDIGGDLAPCGPKATSRPPLFKELIVNIMGPVNAEARPGVDPHLHLGMTKRHDPKNVGKHGAEFTGAVQDGGPGTGGQIFFSQVIRDSKRRIRVGTDLHQESIKDHTDGGKQFGSSQMPVGPGKNIPLVDGDPPGHGHNAQRPKSRYTIAIKESYELFLMWRTHKDAPLSDWLTYGSVAWEWEGVATGISTDSLLTWLAPIEPFAVCIASRRFGSHDAPKKGESGAPTKANHLDLPDHFPDKTHLDLKPAFKDPIAREAGLDDC